MKKTAERTLAECRKRGWIVDKSEEWVPSFMARRRQELGQWLEERLGKLEPGDLVELCRLARLGALREQSRHSFARYLSTPLPVLPRDRQPQGGPGTRRDLHGFVDVHALVPARAVPGTEELDQVTLQGGQTTVDLRATFGARLKLIQSVSGGGDLRRHFRKMREQCEDSIQIALDVPGVDVEIWAWRKVKVKKLDGTFAKRELWRPRIARLCRELEFLDFQIVDEEISG